MMNSIRLFFEKCDVLLHNHLFIVGFLCAVFCILGLFLMAVQLRCRLRERNGIKSLRIPLTGDEANHDEVRIQVSAVKDFIRKLTGNFSCIRVERVALFQVKEFLDMDVSVSFKEIPEQSLPEVISDYTRTLRESLSLYLGIRQIEKINIRIAGLKTPGTISSKAVVLNKKS